MGQGAGGRPGKSRQMRRYCSTGEATAGKRQALLACRHPAVNHTARALRGRLGSPRGLTAGRCQRAVRSPTGRPSAPQAIRLQRRRRRRSVVFPRSTVLSKPSDHIPTLTERQRTLKLWPRVERDGSACHSFSGAGLQLGGGQQAPQRRGAWAGAGCGAGARPAGRWPLLAFDCASLRPLGRRGLPPARARGGPRWAGSPAFGRP